MNTLSPRSTVDSLLRLVRFYLACVEAEDLRALRLPLSAYGRSFLAPWTGKEPLFHPDAVEVPLQVGPAEREFIERGTALAAQTERLFYGYPVHFDKEDYLTPLFFTEVTVSREQGRTVLRRSPQSGLKLNHHLYRRGGLSLEEVLLIQEHLEGEFGSFQRRLEAAFEALELPRPPWNGSLERCPAQGSEEGWRSVAVLFRSEYSQYTRHLRYELNQFLKYEKLSAEAPTTALGSLLSDHVRGQAQRQADADFSPIVPLSAAQQDAVRSALSSPLTVVTGPPGTGKSQVVVSVLAALARAGRPVLFASKNNRAVDVVRERLRELLGEPWDWTLRLGSREHLDAARKEMADRLARLEEVGPPDAPQTSDIEKSRRRLEELDRELSNVSALRSSFLEALERAASAKAKLPAEWQVHNGPTPGRLPAGAEELIERAVRIASGRSLTLGEWLLRVFTPSRAALRCREELESVLQALPEAVAERAREMLEPADGAGKVDWKKHQKAAETLRAYAAWVAAESEVSSTGEALNALRPAAEILEEKARVLGERTGQEARLLSRHWTEMILADYRKATAILKSYFDLVEERPATGTVWREHFERLGTRCREMSRYFPVWIITSLSARQAIPLEPGLFELVIIDEASQCDIASALPLLFRSRRAVIIGDPHQLRHVSTLRPGEEETLAGETGCTDLLLDWSYRRRSLYDAAEAAVSRTGGRPFLLDEHYRSHPEIIEFSNQAFYQGKLVLRTNLAALRGRLTEQPLGVYWHDVQGEALLRGHSAINPAEAEAVIATLERWLAKGLGASAASVGVVTPFRAQMDLIERALRAQPWWPEVQGRVTVGTAHRFQGDERDIMLFSPVVAPGLKPGAAKWVALEEHQLLNVAVTRARAVLHVFGHRRACRDAGGYLARLVEYTEGVADRSQASRFESAAERALAEILDKAGLWYRRQVPVKSFRLDFLLIAPLGGRYDLEVDGRQHLTADALREDAIRDKTIRALGYAVVRIPARDVIYSPGQVEALLRSLS